MPRKALKNTYGYETIAGVEVRRRVIAGQNVPDHYQLEDESAAGERELSSTVVGEGSSTVSPEPDDDSEDDVQPYESMTVIDLRRIAGVRGISIPSGATKSTLIDALEADDLD